METNINYKTYLIDYENDNGEQIYQLVKGPKQLREFLLLIGANYHNGKGPIGEYLDLGLDVEEFELENGSTAFVMGFKTNACAKLTTKGISISIDYEIKQGGN